MSGEQTLARQLRRLGLCEGPPGAEGWSRFLAEVQQTYEAHERERGLLERSLLVSSEESERLTAQLEQAARREVAEHDALRRVATEVASSASPEAIAQLVAEQVAAIAGLSVATVVRFQGGQARIVGAVGPGTRVGHAWKPIPGGPLCEVMETVQASAGPAPDLAGTPRPWLAVPIMVEKSVWGAIAVSSGPCARTADHLTSFAHLVGVAIENAEAHRRLAEQAARDPLTGLYNHRIFHESLERSLAVARRDSQPLSLIIFDIDYFKHVNDTHGHGVGDAVLRELSRRLRGVIRGGDTIARVGGEEFGWIVANADGDAALAAGERLRRVVADTPFGAAGRLSVSVGICDRIQADSAEELYTLADGALYWAKEHGRDRCVLYSPAVVSSLSVREEAERQQRAQTMASVRALARAVDAKDAGTHRHSERVGRNASRLARIAGWPAPDVERLLEAGVLHDVGKIGISDEILTKAGRLTADEQAMIRRHPELGAEIASGLLDDEQLTWIAGHHERWDGSGYPAGLAGEGIPAGARMLALADALDAMLHDRSYRAGLSIEDALAEIRAERGRQFAPEAVDLLDALIETEGLTSLVDPAAPAPVPALA